MTYYLDAARHSGGLIEARPLVPHTQGFGHASCLVRRLWLHSLRVSAAGYYVVLALPPLRVLRRLTRPAVHHRDDRVIAPSAASFEIRPRRPTRLSRSVVAAKLIAERAARSSLHCRSRPESSDRRRGAMAASVWALVLVSDGASPWLSSLHRYRNRSCRHRQLSTLDERYTMDNVKFDLAALEEPSRLEYRYRYAVLSPTSSFLNDVFSVRHLCVSQHEEFK